VLLPGGMGSHLDRSTSPFVNDQSIPFPMYDPVWMVQDLLGSIGQGFRLNGSAALWDLSVHARRSLIACRMSVTTSARGFAPRLPFP
jgi:hypothetical protein